MFDLDFLRKQGDFLDSCLVKRGLLPQSQAILTFDKERRKHIAECEKLLAERNTIAKQSGVAKSSGDEKEFMRLCALQKSMKEDIGALGAKAKEQESEFNALLMTIPNILSEDVPTGKDETENIEVYRWGQAPVFEFQPKEHYELGENMGLMDFKTAGALSGSRFVVLYGALAQLHRVLSQYMLDEHTGKNGFMECWIPVLVDTHTLEGTGHLPKFAEDLYKTEDGKWLIPTAEAFLTNIPQGEMLTPDDLPRRFVSASQCFRLEAGAAGRDTRGMMRQHQFEKVELVSVVTPESSTAELEFIKECAEGILRGLDLPFRTMMLCSGDTGFASQKTYDVEVWLPGNGQYREISSCSLCGDFQARRAGLRYKPEQEARPEYLHTLNGSGVAVGRCLISVMECYQCADGSIAIPRVLQKNFNGATLITAKGELA
jgi:seryl-tRNA synthetase